MSRSRSRYSISSLSRFSRSIRIRDGNIALMAYDSGDSSSIILRLIISATWRMSVPEKMFTKAGGGAGAPAPGSFSASTTRWRSWFWRSVMLMVPDFWIEFETFRMIEVMISRRRRVLVLTYMPEKYFFSTLMCFVLSIL